MAASGKRILALVRMMPLLFQQLLFRLLLRLGFAGMLLVLVSGLSRVQGQSTDTLYSFFVAGHVYGEPGVNNKGVHPPFKEAFPLLRAQNHLAMGFLTGDIVSPFPTAKDWDEVEADLQELPFPVHLVVGNHDMENRPEFEARYGQTWYHLLHENDLFIVLDADLDGWSIRGAQLAYLKQVLSDLGPKADQVFVFTHQLIWHAPDNVFNYIGLNSGAGRSEPLNFWTEVAPLFEALQKPVTFFAGDIGVVWASKVTSDQMRSFRFVASGMGSPSGDNLVLVHVDARKALHFEVVCLGDTAINCFGKVEDFNRRHFSEQFDNPSFAIYPNPAAEQVNIWVEEAGDWELRLIDMQGQALLEKRFESTRFGALAVATLPRGIYLVEVATNQTVHTKRIILN